MAEYPSVDDFVAAYLANCESHHHQTLQQGPSTNGLPFAGANGLQPAYQQAAGGTGQQCPSAAQAPHSMLGVPMKWEQGAGDVYMQPYDQTAHLMCMNQVGQQADWQLQQQQQQQLELLLQQQQQQYQVHQQAQQQQQQQLVPAADAVAAVAAAAAAAAEALSAAAGGRSMTPKSSSRPGSSSKQMQPEASSTTTGKRSSGSKSNSRGRKSKQEQDAAVEQQTVKTDMDSSFTAHNLGHSMSAPPQPYDPAAAAAFAAAQVGGSHSFSAYGQTGPSYDQTGNLTSVLMLQQQTQAARQQQVASAQAMQMQPSLLQEDNEPDMSHLTVMQRYHARRKLAVQRMEREVEEKIAQLAVLEQENRQLKWQAHILENMLLDMDKQVELMSSEELPDASQWLTLLGLGTNAAAGSNGVIARTLHKMLEGAAATDITGWTAEDCRRKWLKYLEQLRPLVEEAEAAQAASQAAQASSSDQQDSALQTHWRPRRAAAAAAVAVIKQEAADVLGVPALTVCPVAGNIPDLPAPQPHAGHVSNQASSKTSGSSPKVVAAAAAGAGTPETDSAAQPMEGVQRDNSYGSNAPAAPAVSDHSGGSFTGSEVSHGPNVDGVPAAVLSKIEHLVLQNFYWLLAIMTRNPVLTYEFISVDLIEGVTPLPPQSHEIWGEALERIELTLEQEHECCTCLQVARRCMAKVIEERAEITAAMQPCVGRYLTVPEAQAWMSQGLVTQNQTDVTVERMRANVRKESVVRNLVGFYCINVVSLYQLAKMSVACSPWFCMAWRMVGAVEEKLNRQLAGEAAMQQQGTGHMTRSSARLAAQR